MPQMLGNVFTKQTADCSSHLALKKEADTAAG